MFKRPVMVILSSVVAVAGLILVLRSFLGPLPMHINSPMNAESAFGLGILLILLARSTTDQEIMTDFRPASPRIYLMAAALVLIIAAAFWRAVHFYFLSDDFVIVKLAGAPLYLRALFTTAGGDGFFRPAGLVSLALTSLWASFNPVSWHLSALAWHAANSLLVFALLIQVSSSRMAAFFGAVLFAVHGSRPEAVAWPASEFDRVSAFFVLTGLLLFIRVLLRDKGRAFHTVLSLACMILAILCKESAYAFPFLLLVFMLSKRNLELKRYRILVPYFAAAAILFAYRLVLFGGIGGYRDLQSGRPSASIIGIIPTLKALLLRLWAVLFFPINWSVQPGLILSILLTAGILSLCWIASRRISRSRMIFPLGFLLLSALPPLHLLLIGSDLQKSRLLYLPSVGFCMLCALAFEKLPKKLQVAVPGALIAFNLAALDHNLDRWEHASSKAKDACAAAVQCVGPRTGKIDVSGLPGSLDGVYFFANGFQECLQIQHAETPKNDLMPAGAAAALSWDEANRELRCR